MCQPGLYQSLHPFSHTRWFLMVFFFFLIFIFIYWFGCAGSLSLHAGSSVFVEACGISFPDQGLNPGPPGVGSVE